MNFHGKEIKTEAKMRFYTGIASVALFNIIFKLIKPYILHLTYWKRQKHATQILKRTRRKQNAKIIKIQ